MEGVVLDKICIEITTKDEKYYFTSFTNTSSALEIIQNGWSKPSPPKDGALSSEKPSLKENSSIKDSVMRHLLNRKKKDKNTLEPEAFTQVGEEDSVTEDFTETEDFSKKDESSDDEINEDEIFDDNEKVKKKTTPEIPTIELPPGNLDLPPSKGNVSDIALRPKRQKHGPKEKKFVSLNVPGSPRTARKRIGSEKKPRSVAGDLFDTFRLSGKSSSSGDIERNRLSDDLRGDISPKTIKSRLRNRLKGSTEHMESVKSSTNQIITQITKPVVDSFKEMTKSGNMKVGLETYPLGDDKLPSGKLYKCTFTISEGKNIGSGGGCAILSLFSVDSIVPIITAKTTKIKSDSPKWDAMMETFLFDDRCFNLKIQCKSSLDISIGTNSVTLSDLSDFATYSEWIPLFDRGTENVKGLICLDIKCAPAQGELYQAGLEEDVEEGINITDNRENNPDHEIGSRNSLSEACTSTLKFNGKIFRDDRHQHKSPRDTKNNSTQNTPTTAKKNKGLLHNILNPKKQNDDSKFTDILEKNYFQSAIAPEKTFLVESNHNISIPFDVPAIERPFKNNFKNIHDEFLNLGEDAEPRTKIVKNIEIPEHSFKVECNPKILLIFPIYQEPAFKFDWPHIQPNHKKQYKDIPDEEIKLGTLKERIVGDYPQSEKMHSSPLELQYELETTDEMKARLYEEKIIKMKTEDEIADMDKLLTKACRDLGLGKVHKNQQLLSKTTSYDDWMSWRENFKKKKQIAEDTLAGAVDDVKTLENPVHETWAYCKIKFAKEEDNPKLRAQMADEIREEALEDTIDDVEEVILCKILLTIFY